MDPKKVPLDLTSRMDCIVLHSTIIPYRTVDYYKYIYIYIHTRYYVHIYIYMSDLIYYLVYKGPTRAREASIAAGLDDLDLAVARRHKILSGFACHGKQMTLRHDTKTPARAHTHMHTCRAAALFGDTEVRKSLSLEPARSSQLPMDATIKLTDLHLRLQMMTTVVIMGADEDSEDDDDADVGDDGDDVMMAMMMMLMMMTMMAIAMAMANGDNASGGDDGEDDAGVFECSSDADGFRSPPPTWDHSHENSTSTTTDTESQKPQQRPESPSQHIWNLRWIGLDLLADHLNCDPDDLVAKNITRHPPS